MQTENLNSANQTNMGGKWLGTIVMLLSLILILGLLWFFAFSPTSPIGAGWFLFSFAAGLSMIVLPCTLPLAFVIVPLSMGKGVKKGLGIAAAFSFGIAITLSMYGVVAALIGEVAIGTLGAPLEVVKNWLYFVAGVATYLFALGELGLISVRMPTYSGAHPGFIQRQGDILKALLLGLFLGNIGVGCPHPATPLILTRIAVSGDVFYGWLLFFIHAIGRVVPLMILAILAIMGVNALIWVIARKDRIERVTGWAMVFVAGFILVLGLFSHDWWVYSGSHSLLETVTQEDRFLGIISGRFGLENPHRHGIEDLQGKTGLFGLPLELGNYMLFLLWVIPMFWYWRKHRAEPNSGWRFAVAALAAVLLWLTFVYSIPHWFLQHKALEEEVMEKSPVSVDIVSTGQLAAKKDSFFEIDIQNLMGQSLSEKMEYSHERLMHVVAVHENFKFFAHIHPEDAAVLTEEMFKKGVFPFSLVFPEDGRYIIAVDFQYDGREVSFTKTFDVGQRSASVLQKDFSRKKKFDGYEVSLDITPKITSDGEETVFKYHFEKDGNPAMNLKPYIGAPAHFAILSVDLSTFDHTHGTLSEIEKDHQGFNLLPLALAHETEIDSRKTVDSALPESFGPDVFLHYTFPYPGLYVVFGEFNDGEKIILTKFMVEVGRGQKNGSIEDEHGH